MSRVQHKYSPGDEVLLVSVHYGKVCTMRTKVVATERVNGLRRYQVDGYPSWVIASRLISLAGA